jgi:MFS family permease
VLGVPIARLADRSNRKLLIVVGVTIWTAMTAISAFATTYTELLLARIGVGIGEATLAPAAMSMIADYFARDRVARALGVFSMGVYLGAGLALLAGSAVVAAVAASGGFHLPGIGMLDAWRLTFLVAALPGILVVALMLTVREPARTEFGVASSSGKHAADLRELLGFLSAHRRLIAAHVIGYGAIGTAVTAYLVWAPEMLRRAYDIPISQAGLLYGVLLLTFGTAGPYLGGWLAQRAAAAGHVDAEIRVSLISTLLLIPVCVLAPLMPTLTGALLVLPLAVLLLSLPQGLAPAVLQLVAPNRLRAQVMAAFILLAVIFAYTVGPTAVPLCAKWVFGSEQELDRALALVCGILTPVGAVALAAARRPYREALIAAGARGPAPRPA